MGKSEFQISDLAEILITEREQIIEECKAVLRKEMDIYRAETLSSGAARVAIGHCLLKVDALKSVSSDTHSKP